MASRFEDRAHTGHPPVQAPAPELRHLTLWADDKVAAQPWQAALLNEGLSIQVVDRPGADADGHLMFLSGGLAAQLARLREQRLAVSFSPLLVACRGLRDLDHVLALEMGADDVIDTAVSPPVVAARLRALWRRQAPGPEPAAGVPCELRFGALRLLAAERRVLLGDRKVPLSEGEFEVLWLLASQAGKAVSRSDILLRVRGLEDHPLDRSIDSRVYRIRAKLGEHAQAATRIRTVRNYGYAFSARDW
jgi:DNA-binding response OmpR family regulator